MKRDGDLIKCCDRCGRLLTAREFVLDPGFRLDGMALRGGTTGASYYFFEHSVPGCGARLSVAVSHFSDLAQEQIPAPHLALTRGCERHCLDQNDLSECSQTCFNAPFRRLMIRIREAKLNPPGARIASLP